MQAVWGVCGVDDFLYLMRLLLVLRTILPPRMHSSSMPKSRMGLFQLLGSV